MIGYRTLTFNAVVALLTAVVGYNWGDILPPKYALIGIVIVNVANMILRAITTTPVGKPL